jgi:cell wall-associated NlpC family hydrolase
MEYIDSVTSEKYYLPAGSVLNKQKKGYFVLNSKKIDLQSYYLEDLYGLNSQHLVYIAKQFLNAPYLWGGKTIFGIDCSGFVQLSFFICGMQLPRDASHQLIFGVQVDFLTDAKTGDLAFFENSQGLITHVGILINNHQIIHASGCVKIENIDAYGIISSFSGEYTHTLSVIKRYF